MNTSNEYLSQEFIELNRENIIQVKEGKNYELYYYNDKLNRWFNHSVQGSKSPLFYHIRTFCKNYIQKFKDTVKNKITIATNNGDTELLEELLKKEDELKKRFNQFTNNDEQIKNIVSMLNQTFSTFTKLQEDCFDNKLHLLPFNNCVVNLKKKGKEKFEEHSRNNYISMFINYDIPFNDEEKINQCYNDFEEMYDGLFTSEYQGVKEDLTFILALALTGIKCVFMPIFNGRGSNGKSVIFDILELVLGRDYFRQMKGDQISEDISTNKPSPEWANMDKKRFGVFKETNGNKCVINLATVKQLGEGNINARGLFSNRTEVINNANYIVMCNDKPSIVGQIDNSIERRIVDIRLPRIFGNPKDKNFQAKMKNNPDIYRECDTKYTEKDSEFVQENMKLGMLFYLLNYIEEFEEGDGSGVSIFEIGQNFKFSNKTIENSKEYIKNEDIISEFLDEYLDFTIKDKSNYKDYYDMNCDFISIIELYQKFRNTDTYKLLDDTDKKSYSQKNFISSVKSNNLVADLYTPQIKREDFKSARHYIRNTYYKDIHMEENIRKQLVIIEEEEEEEKTEAVTITQNSGGIDKEFFGQIIEKIVNPLVSSHNDLQNLVVNEIIPKIGNTNTNTMTNCNNTMNNTTNNNNKFNMNIYLNEKCKDAMTLSDFIDNLKISDEDFETTRTEGIISGLTDIFTKELRNLDVRKLPIHCSDIKRETFYIKEDNEWVKDDGKKSILSRAIDKAKGMANKFLPGWIDAHQNCWKSESPHHTEWMNVITIRFGDGDPKFNEKNTKKIIKNIANEVLIDKETAMIDE